MTDRYQSPLYRSIVERAKRNERQEETMAHGHMPSRKRLTYLVGHLEAISRGETPKGIGPTDVESLVLVKMALAAEEAKPLTDPFAAEYEVVIPANVKNVRIRIEKPEASKIVMDTGSVYLDGERVQEVISRGVDGVTRTTPAIPAEPEVWPEDPRAPKPPADVPEAATDFQAGDWVVQKNVPCQYTQAVAILSVVHGGGLIFTPGKNPVPIPPDRYRRATEEEIARALIHRHG